MSEHACTYSGAREEALVAYIYGEMTPAEHLAFTAHVEDCARCQAELSSFTAVRKQLASWAPPEPTRALIDAALPAAPPPPVRRWAALHDLPVWAQAAAALLVVGVAAGAANVRVTYAADGLSVRTGWLHDERATATTQPSEPLATRAELLALEQRVQQTAQQQETLLAQVGTAKDLRASVIRETQSLLADSERRQENELALSIGRMAQDFQMQRAADNARLNSYLGRFTSTADIRMRQVENAASLAVKVSQQR